MVVLCLSHYVCVCVLLHVAFAWLWLLIICFMMLMAGADNRNTRATCVGSPNSFPTSPGIRRCKPNGTRPHSDSKAIAPEIVHITRASYVVAAVVWHACICTYACSCSFVQLHSTTYIHDGDNPTSLRWCSTWLMSLSRVQSLPSVRIAELIRGNTMRTCFAIISYIS